MTGLTFDEARGTIVRSKDRISFPMPGDGNAAIELQLICCKIHLRSTPQAMNNSVGADRKGVINANAKTISSTLGRASSGPPRKGTVLTIASFLKSPTTLSATALLRVIVASWLRSTINRMPAADFGFLLTMCALETIN